MDNSNRDRTKVKRVDGKPPMGNTAPIKTSTKGFIIKHKKTNSIETRSVSSSTGQPIDTLRDTADQSPGKEDRSQDVTSFNGLLDESVNPIAEENHTEFSNEATEKLTSIFELQGFKDQDLEASYPAKGVVAASTLIKQEGIEEEIREQEDEEYSAEENNIKNLAESIYSENVQVQRKYQIDFDVKLGEVIGEGKSLKNILVLMSI